MVVTIRLTPDQEVLLKEQAKASGGDVGSVIGAIVDSALERAQPAAPKNPAKRVFDLHAGNIVYMSEDFNDELPDSFWFGKS